MGNVLHSLPRDKSDHMHRKNSVLLATFLFAASLYGTAYAKDSSLISNWEILKLLVLDQDVRETAEVSPAESERLKAVLEDRELLERLKLERRRVQRERPGIDIDKAVKVAQLNLNAEVLGRISMILHDSQIQLARRHVLSQRFPTPFSPFADNALLDDFGITLSDAFRKQLTAEERDWARLVLELKSELVHSVLDTIPETSRQRFVNYAGNDYFPSLHPQKVDPNTLPFSSRVRSCRAVFEILAAAELKTAVGITPSQRTKLEAAVQDYNSAVSEAASGRYKVSEIRRKLEEESRKAELVLRTTLSEEQNLTLYRLLARGELEGDLVAVIRRPEIAKYLQLTPEEDRELHELAFSLMEKFKKKVTDSQLQVFERFCRRLNQKAGLELLEAFRGVWGL